MRIAYVCADPGVPVFGQKGCSVHVQEVVRALARRGARVTLFAQRLGGGAPPDLAGVPVYRLPELPRSDPALREQAALDANPVLAALLGDTGPYDLVYERYSLWSYAGMEYAHTTGTPGLLEVNAPLIEEQAAHRHLIDPAGAGVVAARTFAAADALLAVSAEVAAYLERFSPARGRVHVVPNGVDPARFPPRPARAHADAAERFTVGFVGTLKPWHGLPVLVDAFAALHAQAAAARLVLVGDGPERAALEAQVVAHGLQEQVEFTGAVSPAAVPGLLAALDVAVAPYPAQAPFYFSPLKVYEYMAAGLPVVASDIGQIPTVVRDGVTGLLVPPGDAAALVAALARLRRDPALRARLGRAAHAAVLRRHTWDAVATRIMTLAGRPPLRAAS